MSGVGDDGEQVRRLVISAGEAPDLRVVVEAPDGPVCFAAEGRDLITQAVAVAFKSLQPSRAAGVTARLAAGVARELS